MIYTSKTLEKETIKLLKLFSGNHVNKIDAVSIEKYEKKLKHIFDNNKGEAIEIILPGFPYKSANRRDKVFGKLPDLGEEMALKRLNKLRGSIAKKTGLTIKLIICSDGFAFNDIKGIPDHDVIDYRACLRKMAGKYPDIVIQCLDDFMPDVPVEDRRSRLMDLYGTPIEVLKSRLGYDDCLTKLYMNLTAFAKHDLLRLEGESKKAFRKRCKNTGLHVVARSQAWAGLLADSYPNAIRLTIHPYTDVSEKFPICLLPSVDGRWRTPWHNVPVVSRWLFFKKIVKLTPKKIADKGHAHLVYKDNRAWFYSL